MCKKNEMMVLSNEQRNNNAESINTSASMSGYSTAKVTEAIESTQWRKYHSPKGGHGFAAEDANALNDYLRGKHVDKTGLDNSLNGADRIVNGQAIQTKYCNSASRSVNAAFDSSTGQYRYGDQVLEVPKDQYAEAVKLMEQKIREGKVPGVTDPAEASSRVKCGSVTYDQAAKIAKAGNLESLKFDVKNNAVACSCAGGLTFAVAFLVAKSKGVSNKDALKAAAKSGGATSCMAMATGVASQQILRTSAGRTTVATAQVAMKKGIDVAMKSNVGTKVVEKTASAIAKKAVAGVAARNVLTRAMSSNVVTAAVAGVVTSVPDTVRVIRGKITPMQYGKRLATNGAGIGGGCAGTWGGAAVGTMICPGIGTAIGGFIGGICGGIGGTSLTKKLLGK